MKILSILTKLTASYNGPLLGTINTRNIELLTHSDNDQISSAASYLLDLFYEIEWLLIYSMSHRWGSP